MKKIVTKMEPVEVKNQFGDYDQDYTPSKESLKFISFIRAANIEDNANAEIHYRLADKLFSDNKNERRVLIESFRGSAKSTIIQWFKIYIAVLGYCPGFGTVDFIAFIGDSMENGVKNTFRNIETKIERSDFLKQFITIKRKTDSEVELVNKDGKELDIKGYGANTSIRGVTYKGKRPDMVILDDITRNDAINSVTIQDTINDNFYKSILPALNPNHFKIFFIGTPLSERDLIHQLSRNPSWVAHKYPIAEKIPCKKEEFKGGWEDRFSYEVVMDQYKMYEAAGKTQDFYQEFMLQITDLRTLLVDEKDIQWFDPVMFLRNKSKYNYYISTDFATSTKKSADFSTIGVWAISSNNDWLLIDGQCLRQTMQENIEDIFRYVKKWNPISVGIESSGQQGGFLSIFQELMIKNNIWFSFASKKGSTDVGIRPTTDKVQRFVTGVQPKFKQNKIWFPRIEDDDGQFFRLKELVDELCHELSVFTLAGGVKALKHDDAIDLLNQLSEMDIFTPSDDYSPVTKIEESGLVWHFKNEDDGFEAVNNTIF